MFATFIAVFYSAHSQTKMNDVFVDINFVSTFTVHRKCRSITRVIGLLEKFCLRYSSSFSAHRQLKI